MNTPPVPIDGYGNVSHAVEHDLLGDMVITAAINTDASALSQTLARPSGSSSTNLPSEAKLLRCISAPRETFTPLFDTDGNQTRVKTMTGIWQVTYNGENRPIRWESNNQIISNQTILTMTYDRMDRRREKNAQRFFYDGYLQIADNSCNVKRNIIDTPIEQWKIGCYETCNTCISDSNYFFELLLCFGLSYEEKI